MSMTRDELNIPILTCPHCEKTRPLAIKRVRQPLLGRSRDVEMQCPECQAVIMLNAGRG